MGKEQEQDEINFEQIQKTLKQKTYQLIKSYLQHCSTINPIIIYLIIIIQTLQILWFSIHPQLTFLKNPFLLSYIRSALAYLNFENFIQNNNSLLFPFVLLAFCIVVLYGLVLGVSAGRVSGRGGNGDKEEFTNIVNKIAAYLIVLVNSVFFIPIYNVSIITLYCQQKSYYYQNSNGQCYDTLHIILCILSGINLIVILTSSLLYWFIFYIRNPFSKSYYAIYNNLFRLGKLLLKILFPLYFLIDQKDAFQNVFVIVQLVLVFAYVVFFRINSIHNFYPNFFYCQLFLQSLLLWFCISTAIAYKIQNSGMSFAQSCLCSVVFAYTVCTIQAAIARRFFDMNISGTIKKQDREKFVYSLIHILFKETTQNQISPLVYIKLLNSNMNLCSLKISKYLKKGDLKSQQLIEITRNLLLALLNKFFQDTPTVSLKLVKSLVLFDSGCKILSLHQINEIRTDKLSIYEQFLIYYFKSTKNLYQEDQRKSNSEDNMTQIHTYLQFTQLMNQFEYQLEKCAKNNQQFWEQLCEDILSTNKVFNLAENSIVYGNRVSQLFKKLEAIFPENLVSLFLYYQFLVHVCAKNKEHNKVKQRWDLERERQLKKQAIEIEEKSSKIKYKANQKMCVLHVSTTSTNIGAIINCNSQVKRYLGYDKSELINQKVTKIMPKIYGQIHDNFIRDYLERADQLKLPVQKTVFAFKKNLKMIESYLAVKIFPNITTGFQMVGFFKQMNVSENLMNIMVNMKTLEIEGMTEAFLNLADNRIKLQEIQKEPLRLSHLFPEIQPNHAFKIGQELHTLFRFSDCTDKLIQVDQLSYEIRKKYDKQIILIMQQINYYPNAQIGILSIEYSDVVSMQETTKNIFNQQPRIQQLDSNNRLSRDSRRKNTRSRQEFQRQQVSLERKMEDFMGSNSHLFEIFLIKILFFVCFISLTIVSVILNIYDKDSGQQYKNILSQIQLSNNISILYGKILTQNKIIKLESSDPEQFMKQKNLYMDFLKQLQLTSTKLFESSNENDRKMQKLVINQQKIYQFQMLAKNNTPQIQNLHLYDGILQIVFTGVDLLSNNITDFQTYTSQEMKSAYYLIEENMEFMLPSISESVTNAYSNYFIRYITNQMSVQIYFVSGKTTTFLLVYFLVCFAISKFMRFNNIFVEIYNSILKWDAHELYLKCFKFRTKSFEGAHTNGEGQQNTQEQKKPDIWKIFPRSLIVKLSQGKIKNSNKTQSLPGSSYLNNTNISDEQQRLKDSNTPKTSIQPIEARVDFINIKLDVTFKKKFVIIFLLLLSLTCLNYSALFFKSYYNTKLDQQRENSVNLGKYSKTFLYTLFYGSQIIEGQDQYKVKYFHELNKFYDISTNVSHLIGDPNPYLRQVYRQIEIINSFSKGELSTLNQTTKTNLIAQSQRKLFELSNQINKFSREHEANTMMDIGNLQKTIKIVKIVLDIVITILFCRLAQIYLLEAVEKQLLYSCNMLKMLPVWIIAKNKKIQDILFSKLKLEAKPESILKQESAVNLMQASRFQQMEFSTVQKP